MYINCTRADHVNDVFVSSWYNAWLIIINCLLILINWFDLICVIWTFVLINPSTAILSSNGNAGYGPLACLAYIQLHARRNNRVHNDVCAWLSHGKQVIASILFGLYQESQRLHWNHIICKRNVATLLNPAFAALFLARIMLKICESNSED